jgi:hypothetical protein
MRAARDFDMPLSLRASYWRSFFTLARDPGIVPPFGWRLGGLGRHAQPPSPEGPVPDAVRALWPSTTQVVQALFLGRCARRANPEARNGRAAQQAHWSRDPRRPRAFVRGDKVLL